MIWIITIIVLTILAIAINFTQKKIQEIKEKWREIECGLNPITPQHIPFSFQFFFIAILFLIFDIEIAIVLSFPVEASSIKKIITITAFLIILIIGLIYELQKGKIKWSNWTRKLIFARLKCLKPWPLT